MELLNTKLPPTKTENYDKINTRLKWLWYTSNDVYKFFTPEEIKIKIDKFIGELNTEDFGMQKYSLYIGQNHEYFLVTENNKFNLKIIEKIGNKIFSNFSFKSKVYKYQKVVQFNFQRNYLSELAHNIKINEEKICNISVEKRGDRILYMIRYDRHTDCEPFYNVLNGKYIPNEIGKKIQLVQAGDFGSANEGFIASDESLKLVITTLQKFGYEVGFTNIFER